MHLLLVTFFFQIGVKPDFMGLREKILETYTEGESSYRQIAKFFRVSFSLITRVISHYQKENTLESSVKLTQYL